MASGTVFAAGDAPLIRLGEFIHSVAGNPATIIRGAMFAIINMVFDIANSISKRRRNGFRDCLARNDGFVRLEVGGDEVRRSMDFLVSCPKQRRWAACQPTRMEWGG